LGKKVYLFPNHYRTSDRKRLLFLKTITIKVLQDNPKNIDHLFKKHQHQFDKMPSENAWNRLENMLDQTQSVQEETRIKPIEKSRFNWRYVAAALLLLTFGSLGWFFTQQLNDNTFIAGSATSSKSVGKQVMAGNKAENRSENASKKMTKAAKALSNSSNKEKTPVIQQEVVAPITKQKDKAVAETKSAPKIEEEKFFKPDVDDADDVADAVIMDEIVESESESEAEEEIIEEEVIEFEEAEEIAEIEEVTEEAEPIFETETATSNEPVRTTNSGIPAPKAKETESKKKKSSNKALKNESVEDKEANFLDEIEIAEEIQTKDYQYDRGGLSNSVRNYKSPQYNWLIGDWASEDGLEMTGIRSGTFDLQLNEFSFQYGDAVLSRSFEIIESAEGVQLKVIDMVLDRNKDDVTIRLFNEVKSSAYGNKELLFEYLAEGEKKQIAFKNNSKTQFSLIEINENEQKSTIFSKKP